MGRKLRIFISSTMKDLANERDAICSRLRSFNFEPVNAEGWSPTGSGSWARISQEIESSDVFLLLIGERYGWIPTDGPKSEFGLSVTHLEYKEACARQLPILPFLKKLSYDSDRTSEDAKKRDAFRSEVQEWSRGQFVGQFELASDLADKAGLALIELLIEGFVTRRIRERAQTVEETTRTLTEHAVPKERPPVTIPAELVDAMKRREVILFAGAGISLSAGLPSAIALGQYLAGVLKDQPEYVHGPGAATFATIATDVALFQDRQYLENQVVKILDPPFGPKPTIAHHKSVRLFDYILTTNWDNLFEIAAASEKQSFELITEEIRTEPSGPAILKLHGSVGDPESLLLTELDVVAMDNSRPRLWRFARYLLSRSILLVVGSSLRDPSVIRLLSREHPFTQRYFVTPNNSLMTEARLKALGFTVIVADSDDFFIKLAEQVSR